MKTGKFVYAKRTPEQFKAAANRRGGGFDSYLKRDFKRYKMRDGKNLIRFLPPTWDVDPKTGKSKSDDYSYMIWVNYDVGPDKGSYLSLSSMGKGADPLAEARREATRKGDQALVKALSPSPRWVAWVIDRQSPPEEGPQLFDYPGKLRTAINTASQDEDTNELVYVDDPDDGADVRFYKEGQGKTGTNYPGEKVKVLKSTPLSDDGAEAEAWKDFVVAHPIPDCLNFYDYDHISMVYNGAVAKDEDEEGDNQPAPKAANTDEDETLPWKRSRMQRGAEEEEEPDAEEKEPVTKTTSVDDEDDSGSLKERLRRRRERLQGEKA